MPVSPLLQAFRSQIENEVKEEKRSDNERLIIIGEYGLKVLYVIGAALCFWQPMAILFLLPIVLEVVGKNLPAVVRIPYRAEAKETRSDSPSMATIQNDREASLDDIEEL